MSCAFVITEHACQRARERLGLSRRATARMAAKAYERGLSPERTSGALRAWLDSRVLSHRGCTLRVYGEALWAFQGTYCTTVMLVPKEYRPAVRAAFDARARACRPEVRP